MCAVQIIGHETEAGIMLRGASRDQHNSTLLQWLSALLVMQCAGSLADWHWHPQAVLPAIKGFSSDQIWDWSIIRGWWEPVTGARAYVDHFHPEWSTPEEQTPRAAVRRAVQGQRQMEAAAVALATDARRNPGGHRIMLFGNNTDGDPNTSFGGHVSISFSDAVARGEFTRPLASFMTVLQVLTGTGSIAWDRWRQQYSFWISQRGPYMERVVGSETTVNRPIINTRDTSLDHDPSRRRMHIISLDTNMNEAAGLLKDGLLMIVMSMIEEGVWPRRLELAHILDDFRGVAADPSLSYQLTLVDGRQLTALQLLREWESAIDDYFDTRRLCRWQSEVLELFDEVLDLLTGNKFAARPIIEWIYKYELMLGRKRKLGLPDGQWRHPALGLIDLQYHSYVHTPQVEGDRIGLYHQARQQGRVRSLFSEADLADETPSVGRAGIRQLVLRRYGPRPFRSWAAMVLEDPDDPVGWRRGLPYVGLHFHRANGPVPPWLRAAVAASPRLRDLCATLSRLVGDDGGVRDNLEIRFRPDHPVVAGYYEQGADA